MRFHQICRPVAGMSRWVEYEPRGAEYQTREDGISRAECCYRERRERKSGLGTEERGPQAGYTVLKPEMLVLMTASARSQWGDGSRRRSGNAFLPSDPLPSFWGGGGAITVLCCPSIGANVVDGRAGPARNGKGRLRRPRLRPPGQARGRPSASTDRSSAGVERAPL